MNLGERLLSLAARLPAALLPFASALGLSSAGFLLALSGAAAALCAYWLVPWVMPWILKRAQPRHVLLCTAVMFVILTVVLIVAVEQQAQWSAVLLSGAAGLSAPPERAIGRSGRLERTAVGFGVVVVLVCGLVSAWVVPLVAAAFLAATAVPLLVMIRSQPPRKSATAVL